jgi:cell division septum initiation protein DivIVA
VELNLARARRAASEAARRLHALAAQAAILGARHAAADEAARVMDAARAEARAITDRAHRQARQLVAEAEAHTAQRPPAVSSTMIDLAAAPVDHPVLDRDSDETRLIDERNRSDLDRLHARSLIRRWRWHRASQRR